MYRMPVVYYRAHRIIFFFACVRPTGLDISEASVSSATSKYTWNRPTSKTWRWRRARRRDAPSACWWSRPPVPGCSGPSNRISSCVGRASGTPAGTIETFWWDWTSAACPASTRWTRCTTFRCVKAAVVFAERYDPLSINLVASASLGVEKWAFSCCPYGHGWIGSR